MTKEKKTKKDQKTQETQTERNRINKGAQVRFEQLINEKERIWKTEGQR